MRAMLRQIDPATRRRAANQAAAHAAALLHRRRTVAVYLSHGNELGTMPLIRRLLRRGHRLCAPQVRGDEMRFVALKSNSQLRRNRFGILEPVAAPRLRPQALLVPLLAFDAAGRRLGRGAGFYDRALSRQRAPCFGFAYALQQLDRVPEQAHDVRLRGVVNERGVLWAIG